MLPSSPWYHFLVAILWWILAVMLWNFIGSWNKRVWNGLGLIVSCYFFFPRVFFLQSLRLPSQITEIFHKSITYLLHTFRNLQPFNLNRFDFIIHSIVLRKRDNKEKCRQLFVVNIVVYFFFRDAGTLLKNSIVDRFQWSKHQSTYHLIWLWMCMCVSKNLYRWF